jgi:hypothetical protein
VSICGTLRLNVLSRFLHRVLSARITAPPDTSLSPCAPFCGKGWRHCTCGTPILMSRGRASCLLGTPGLPHRAQQVGRLAPLLAVWFKVGPARAASTPLTLRLSMEGHGTGCPIALWREHGQRDRRSRRHDSPANRGCSSVLRFVGGAIAPAAGGGGAHAHLVEAGAFNAAPRLLEVALGLSPVLGPAWSLDLLHCVVGREAGTCPGPGWRLGRRDPLRHLALLGLALTCLDQAGCPVEIG